MASIPEVNYAQKYPANPEGYEKFVKIGFNTWISKVVDTKEVVVIKMYTEFVLDRGNGLCNAFLQEAHEIYLLGKNNPGVLSECTCFFVDKVLWVVSSRDAWLEGSIYDIMLYNYVEEYRKMSSKCARPKNFGLSEVEAKCVAIQVLNILKWYHDNFRFYRDLNVRNVLIGHRGNVFLNALTPQSVLQQKAPIRGNPPYWIAPELTLGLPDRSDVGPDEKKTTQACDVWSFGIMLLELIFGDSIFADYHERLLSDFNDYGQSKKGFEFWILLTQAQQSKISNSNLPNVIELCLQYDSRKRPTINSLLKHPFFDYPQIPEYLHETLLRNLPSAESRWSVISYIYNSGLNDPAPNMTLDVQRQSSSPESNNEDNGYAPNPSPTSTIEKDPEVTGIKQMEPTIINTGQIVEQPIGGNGRMPGKTEVDRSPPNMNCYLAPIEQSNPQFENRSSRSECSCDVLQTGSGMAIEQRPTSDLAQTSLSNPNLGAIQQGTDIPQNYSVDFQPSQMPFGEPSSISMAVNSHSNPIVNNNKMQFYSTIGNDVNSGVAPRDVDPGVYTDQMFRRTAANGGQCGQFGPTAVVANECDADGSARTSVIGGKVLLFENNCHQPYPVMDVASNHQQNLLVFLKSRNLESGTDGNNVHAEGHGTFTANDNSGKTVIPCNELPYVQLKPFMQLGPQYPRPIDPHSPGPNYYPCALCINNNGVSSLEFSNYKEMNHPQHNINYLPRSDLQSNFNMVPENNLGDQYNFCVQPGKPPIYSTTDRANYSSGQRCIQNAYPNQEIRGRFRIVNPISSSSSILRTNNTASLNLQNGILSFSEMNRHPNYAGPENYTDGGVARIVAEKGVMDPYGQIPPKKTQVVVNCANVADDSRTITHLNVLNANTDNWPPSINPLKSQSKPKFVHIESRTDEDINTSPLGIFSVETENEYFVFIRIVSGAVMTLSLEGSTLFILGKLPSIQLNFNKTPLEIPEHTFERKLYFPGHLDSNDITHELNKAHSVLIVNIKKLKKKTFIVDENFQL